MRATFLIFFNILFSLAYSQTDGIRFKYLTSDKGLSSSCVNDIVQDNEGFTWIGTDEGLNKFDGYNFEIFKNHPKDTTSLYSNYIFSLYYDNEGYLWIGTSRGVNIYDKKTHSITRRKEIPICSVFNIKKDNEGNVLIGAQKLYVLYKNSGKVAEYRPDKNDKNSISSGNISSIYIDTKNRIWIGTSVGLNLFDIKKGTFKHFLALPNNKNSLNGNDVRSITEDKNHIIWVGTSEGLNALKVLDDKADSVIFKSFVNNPSDPSSISQGAITNLYCDDQNNLWIGSRNGGLNILQNSNQGNNSSSFLHFTFDEYSTKSVNNNSINCIFGDSSGNVWIGTYGGGVNLYCRDTKKFQLYTHYTETLKTINNNQVNAFLEDGDYIWIGTEGGLNRYNKKTKTYNYFTFDKNNPSSIGANAVWSIIKDRKNRLWVGTWGGGLNLFDYKSERFKRFLHNPDDISSISNNNVFAILPDKKDNLWIGTMGGGLNYFNIEKNIFYNYTVPKSHLTTSFIEEIIEISDSKLLLANVDWLTVFDKTTDTASPFIKNFMPYLDIGKIRVSTMFIDSKKNLWLGTEAGLIVFSPDLKNHTYYTTTEGLPNNSIKSILEDDYGNLWLGTNGGISKFLQAITIPDNPVFYNYSHQDGLQGNEFNRRACLKSSNGYMYFGGPNGFNVFHPDSITSNIINSEVIITDFMLFNKPVVDGKTVQQLDINEKKQIVLNFKQNSFGFKYVSINYLAPEKQKYAFMLKGFENEWNYVDDQMEANYTNMDPGNYEFLVKVSESNGNVYNYPTILKIKIRPPVWLTIWAYMLYAIIIFLILLFYRQYAIIKINTRNEIKIERLTYQKQEEINQAKLTFFTNLSHEIRTPLTLISAPVEDLFNKVNDNIYIKEQLKYINQNVQRLLFLINQLLDFSKIDAGGEKLKISYRNLTALINEIIDAFQYQRGIKKIKISVLKNDDVYIWFDIEKMTTVLYNLMANAIKYNNEYGQIEIEIKKIKQPPLNVSNRFHHLRKRQKRQIDFIEVRISDKGLGIPKDQLENIFDRYYQAFESNSVRVKGTGIGLDITKKYIELHGGRIWVESEVGEGSCFIFQVPANKEDLNADEIVENKNINKEFIEDLINSESSDKKNAYGFYSNPEILPKSKNPVLLIVDDSIELVNYLENKLQNNFTILKAPDGLQGLTLAHKYDPDIIVTDIIMPEIDGVTLTTKLKSDLNTSHIPIIILTAKTYDQSRIEGLEKGADVYLTKPFKIEVLQAYIITLLETRKKLKEKYCRQLTIEPAEITINTVDEEFIKKLIVTIDKNISNINFNVDQLSNDMNLSYRVLARKVKRLTNQTVNEFIRSQRLKRAVLILSNDKISISEVSTLTGFNDPAYFSRCFQKQFGVAPTQYPGKIVAE